MVFCSTQLAARIERAERSLVEGAALRIRGRDPSVTVCELAGGAGVFTGPGSPLNKIVGVGFQGDPDPRALAEVEAAFAAHGAAVSAEVSTLADPAVLQFFAARGYALRGFENVLGLPLGVGSPSPAPSSTTDAVVTGLGAGELELWINTVVTGFATPDTQGVASTETYDRAVIDAIIRDFAQAGSMRQYLAWRGDARVGGASMRIADGIAQLCGAATLPEHRCRGVQTALLMQRLADATAAGCDLAVLTALPGSKSHENAQRRGFRLLYARAVLVREPAPGG